MTEAIYLAPNFLEDLVSDNLLDPVPGGIIRMEPFCQIALKRNIPEIADILAATIIAEICSSFDQLRFRHQGTTLPAFSLVVDRAQNRAQFPVTDEIPLMEVVEVIHEELHIPGLQGQNQTALLLCHGIATLKLPERAVRGRIALNIA